MKHDEHQVYLDILTFKPKSDNGIKLKMNKLHWLIIVDERTLLKFIHFFETKDGMLKPMCKLFQEWKDKKIPVTHWRMDNTGKNKKLIARCKSSDWKLGIRKFELMARNTPQQKYIGTDWICNNHQ